MPLPRPSRKQLLFALALLVAAAAVAFALRGSRALPGAGGARGPSMRLVAEGGADPARAKVGDALELQLAAGPYAFALAVEIDDKELATSLWPSDSARSGPLGKGGHARVSLRAPGGPARIVAGFSDRSISVSDLISPARRSDIAVFQAELGAGR